MKVNYRGCDIEVTRERSMGGDMLLYYSIFRTKDGYEVTSGFWYGSDKIRDYIRYMKERVDEEIKEAGSLESIGEEEATL